MTNKPQDEFNGESGEQLRSLKNTPAPPPWLEEFVVHALRQRRLLRSRHSGRAAFLRQAAVVAACAAFFLAGLLIGWHKGPGGTASQEPRFVLFLEQIEGQAGSDPNLEAQRVREYTAWARKQEAAGHLLAGEKLEDTALLMNGLEGRAQPVGTQQPIGGFFIITAENLERAIAVARTCPHLRYGGRIVIRPVAHVP